MVWVAVVDATRVELLMAEREAKVGIAVCDAGMAVVGRDKQVVKKSGRGTKGC